VNWKPRHPFILTLAVACAGAAIGTAFAVVTDTSDSLPRDRASHEGMSLAKIAAAATGRPGEIAPPCPDVATVTRLKEADIPFGPCDVLVEKGAPVRIAGPEKEAKPDEVVCPALLGKAGLDVQLPCRRGAKIVASAIVEVDGRDCARVTYIAETGSPARTETLCAGDVPSVGGAPVTGPPDDES
jgi:hypothetical protein